MATSAGLRLVITVLFQIIRRSLSDDNELLPGIRRQRAQGFLSTVIQNQSDRLAKICQTLFTRLALAVRPRHFGAIGDIPGAVLLDNRREFVVHRFMLPPAGRGLAVRDVTVGTMCRAARIIRQSPAGRYVQ